MQDHFRPKNEALNVRHKESIDIAVVVVVVVGGGVRSSQWVDLTTKGSAIAMIRGTLQNP